MNKNRYFMVIICASLITSSMVFAGPWEWVEDKISSIWLTYKRWNIPRPRLIDYQIMELGGKKFEEFRYDLSQDTDATKNLRKKLHISGIYLSNDSNQDFYGEYLQRHPVPDQYIQNGFDVNRDNSISQCMGRLFEEMSERGAFVMFRWTHEEEAWTQLLWELEASLPKDFDTDITGEKFIAVINTMFPEDIRKKRKKMLGHYVPFWGYYTLRFKHSKGLEAAYRRLMGF